MIETERAPEPELDCDEALLLVARDVTTGLDRARQAQLRAHLSQCPSCEQARGIVEHADDLEALPIVDPAYYVRGRVEGRGGMGRIIIARDRRLGRMVALKEILDDSLRERFEREIRVTARLDHPNIVTIHEAGRWPDGAPFFAMRWIDGESLASRLAAVSTKWTDRAALVPCLIAAAQAIAYAHGQRVVHRDLKPANILIGPYGETVVIDWGLAVDLDEHEERTTSGLSGTPHYMAPEQALGEPPDPRMDVYALGATLYHVITGAPPYTGSLEAVLESLLRGPPKPITALVPDAPADLVAVVTKAMEHDPARRYPDAQSLADDLARFVAGQLVSVRAPPLRERIARWVRRHRAVVAVAAVALVAIAALGVWSLGERDRAARNEHAAHREKAQNERHAHRLHRALAHEVRALLQVDDEATRRAIFDLQLATPRLAWETAPAAAVTQVASSESGKLLVAGHTDGSVRAWRADGTPVQTHELSAHVLAVAINDDGVIAASDKHGITVWRPGAAPLHLKPVGFAHALALDAAGTRVTASGLINALALASWELRADGTAELTHSQLRLDRRDAPYIALRGDGEVAAIVSATRPPRTLRIVSTRDGSIIREIADADHSRPWFSADGTRVYQRRGLDGIRAWHIESGEEDQHLGIRGRSISGVFASYERETLRWLLAKDAGITLSSPPTPIAFDGGRAATFAGDLVVIGHADGSLQAFDLVERCIGRRLPEFPHALAFDVSSRRVAVDSGTISIWTVDGRHITDVRRPRTSNVDALAFADDNTLVVLARRKTEPRHLEWWDLTTGEPTAPPAWIAQHAPYEVRALTERHVLVAAGGELALHELASGAVIASMPDPGKPVRVMGRPPRIVVDKRPTSRSPTSHLDAPRAVQIDALLDDDATPAAVSDDGEWIARRGNGGVELFRTDDASSLLTAPPEEVAARVRRCARQ